jgi:hypothetical protein
MSDTPRDNAKSVAHQASPGERKRTLPAEFAELGGWHSNSYPDCAHDNDKERFDASIDAMARCC